MNFTPRYLGRGSWLAGRDPRVLVLGIVLFMVGALQVWDGRLVAVIFVGAIFYYRTAGIPWRDARPIWTVAAGFLVLLVLLNLFLTGGVVPGFAPRHLHVLFRLPPFGTPVSAESVAFGATQVVRSLSMVAVGFPVAFAIAPADLGATFAGLRVPYKFAYAVDLTFRFIPSLSADLQTTIDAQRVRGHEFATPGRNPIRRLRGYVPLVVPLTMNTIVAAEDTIDAMDLRAFGTGPRTWLRVLRFDATDRLLITIFVAFAVGLTIAGWLTTSSRLYVPDVLIGLAGG